MIVEVPGEQRHPVRPAQLSRLPPSCSLVVPSEERHGLGLSKRVESIPECSRDLESVSKEIFHHLEVVLLASPNHGVVIDLDVG